MRITKVGDARGGHDLKSLNTEQGKVPLTGQVDVLLATRLERIWAASVDGKGEQYSEAHDNNIPSLHLITSVKTN